MELFQYQYSIKNVVITIKETTIEVNDGSVTYLFIYHDYINRRMPVIKMHVELGDSTLSEIYKDLENAILKFDLYEHQTDNDGNVLNTTLYIQHSYHIIPTKTEIDYITSQDTNTEQSIDEMRKLQLFETYLIDMVAVNWFSKEINVTFKDASRPDAIQALLAMRDVPPGIVIATPPEVFDKIDYIIVPMGDLVGNLWYINGQYGLYGTNPIVYYDGEYLYCINKKTPNIHLASTKDFDTITLLLPNPTDPARNIMGSCNDMETKSHYINIREVPEIVDTTNKISSTKFSTIIYIDKNGTVSKRTLDEEASALAYIYAPNDLTVDQIINEQYIGHQVTVQINNAAVSFLKPYKSVLFDVGEQLLNLNLTGHEYRITGWSISITREGAGADTTYIHDTTLTLINPEHQNSQK